MKNSAKKVKQNQRYLKARVRGRGHASRTDDGADVVVTLPSSAGCPGEEMVF